MASIFTKIINREIPADIVFEQDNIIVIKDLNPRAKTHLLVIPKKEILTLDHIKDEDSELLSQMLNVILKVTRDLWINEGYKLLLNVWKKWWQEVMHIHMHILSDI